MTIVRYVPRRQVVIHEYSSYDDVQSLVRNAFGGAPPGSNVGTLKWVDGVVMLFTAMPLTSESVVKELLEGTLHWDHVSFAAMGEYQPNIHIPEERITCSVVNVSTSPIFRDIAKFIRKTLMRQKSQGPEA